MMYHFKVEYCDTDEGLEVTFVDTGIVSANSWIEAAKKLNDYYGEENIISLDLYLLEDILFTEGIVDVLSEDFDED